MAPLKLINKNTANGMASISSGICTRSQNALINTKLSLKQVVKATGKRKAGSPIKEGIAKRAAFGDITNAISNALNDKDKNVAKKVTVIQKTLNKARIVKKKDNRISIGKKAKDDAADLKKSSNIDLWPLKRDFNVGTTVIDDKREPYKTILKIHHEKPAPECDSIRFNDDLTEESLYISAAESMSNDSNHSSANKSKTEKEMSLSRDINLLAISDRAPPKVPDDVNDFDAENWNDHFQVSHYAMDIFNYLKERESRFVIEDYLPRQKHLTNWMRALLVDWMVEVQESFELNHETLYLAVKLVDLYLCKVPTKKEELQLLGSAALFISSKFDERIPPLISDFLYICDGAYTMSQILTMEINILKTIGFDLGIPLSYRFLRRYARCARVNMPTLTLARFILELCLMEYSMISFSDSKMAAAALYLAIKMMKLGPWTSTHIYYTGYQLEEIMPIVQIQNMCLHKKPKEALSTVRNKYTHRLFFEVAKTPLINQNDLT